jgi:FKBP-type peptidyl-prolyl cis-trans isomerase (trigger factor)
MQNIKDLKTKNVGVRKVEITGEIEVDKVKEAFSKSLAKIKENITIDGFRKGLAPESVVLQRVGDLAVLEESADDLLNEHYPLILDELKLDTIGHPEIKITKIAKDNPLGFSIISYLRPEVSLPDYKKIAKDANSKKDEDIKVEEKEVSDVILDLRKSVAHEKMHNDGSYSHDDHSHPEIKDEDLPPVNLEFLKKFGDFKTEDDLKARIKENITKEKENKAKDKKRSKLLEDLLKETKIEMPDILIDGELDKMVAEFKDDLARSGLSFDDYLKHIKKTLEDIKKEWKPVAETRAKTQILLYEVSKAEKIEPKEEDIKREMDIVLSSVKDADRFRVRMFVENFLTNDLTLKFLENIK